MKKAGVLGCGLVGSVMAKTLAGCGEYEVFVADISEKALSVADGVARLTARVLDLSDPASVQSFAGEMDIVLGAIPSRFAYAALEAVVRTRKPYCDISFMPEDATRLDALAKEFGATAIVDCGVSPGLSNMMVAQAASQLDEAQKAVIYVGGLPKEKSWPYAYKAPFAPSDVIEEYTRPARMIENGSMIERPALSDPEFIEFPRVGKLEAFNTDGLRSLLKTVKIPDMREKTLRYPGHIDLMRVFRETGFFSKETVDVGGAAVRPLDLTSKLLFPMWKLAPNDHEFTVLRVIVEGIKNGSRVRHFYDLYDEYDEVTGYSSMSRTTGFPNIIAAKLLANGRISDPGVFPPELIATRNGMFEHFVGELEFLGVKIESHTEKIA